MKSPALILLAAILAAPVAHATLLLEESFDYTAGQTLATANANWVQFNVGTTNNLTTNTTNLSVSGLEASTGGSIGLTGAGTGNRHMFAPQTTGTTVYYSFAIQVTNLASFTTTNASPFMALQATDDSTHRGGGIFMNPVTSEGSTVGYTLGINRLNNAPTAGGVQSGVTLSAGQTYFVVAAYGINSGNANDSVSLWISPASSSFGETAPTATVSISASSTDLPTATGGINSLVILHGSGGSGLPSFLIDEVRVGTTWADVTPASIPEPSSIALLAGGLAICATAVMRRRSHR